MTHATTHTWHTTQGDIVAPVYHNNEPVIDIREHLVAKQRRYEMLVANSTRYAHDEQDMTHLNTPFAGEGAGTWCY